MDEKNQPYTINREDAVYLYGIFSGEKNLPERSNADLVSLLRETMKMADSIADNCREWLELTAICEANIAPHSAEKLNVPTVAGALSAAIAIPRVDCEGKCPTCAFNIGSPANQTEATAEDILYCLENEDIFRCHHDDNCKKACIGFIHVKQKRSD